MSKLREPAPVRRMYLRASEIFALAFFRLIQATRYYAVTGLAATQMLAPTLSSEEVLTGFGNVPKRLAKGRK